MAQVDAAEKEASEVLHTLLSVERIEKQEGNDATDSAPFQGGTGESTEGQNIQWHGATVPLAGHSLFTTIDATGHYPQAMEDQQVIWEGHAIQVDQDKYNMTTIYTQDADETAVETPSSPKKAKTKSPTAPKSPTKKKIIAKKKKKLPLGSGEVNDPTKLEESAVQVKERFRRGCECQDESCFRGLNPENVYRHRLNIAELTKGEHDMYLMGVTMACLANPDTTVRHKERRRLRAQYVYQGRRVCLDAFLYLENCTHYQLKRIRKHVMTHGVAPRVHGNHGKKPHNTFSLDIYRHATEFLKQYLEQHLEDYQRLPCCEEIEMQTTAAPEPLCVEDVVDILHSQFAIISGGKSKDGCPIITFPDNNKFCLLNDLDYQQLMLYLTSVPSLQEADLGFHLIIDRRKDRWNSVKAVLLKISEYFPGLIHVVYVLKPTSFLQKALSEVSNTFFKEEFKFRMIFLSTEHELHEHVEPSQLTTDLGGSFIYIHEHWIKQRIELEKFSQMTQQVSQSLDEFTKLIEETELPNNVDSTQLLQDRQSVTYFDLKREILSAATHGESLLRSIKETTMVNIKDRTPSSDTIGNVFAVERLLVQLEETERTFDEFWQDHFTKLRHCLELRRFEQDFRELQINFEQHMKTVADMTEMPDSMERCEILLRDFEMFEKLCYVDVYRAEEVISCGQHLISIKTCPLECVEPKCTELIRIRNILTDKLDERKEDLIRAKELISKIAKGNKWCANGIELLASQNIAECGNSIELATRYYEQIGEFFKLAADFTLAKPTKDCKYTFQEPSIQPLAPLVSQVTQGVENVFLMCEKRYTSLKKLAVPPLRPAGNVLPAEPVVPMQPQGGAPHPNKAVLRKAYTIPKMDSGNPHIESETTLSPENDEVNRVKRGHVLTELLETERIYVTELLSIIKGYKVESQTGDMANLLPPGFSDKMEVIFGNLEEILQFHENIFLKDLENCISSVDLVALCFVQKRDTFFRLYSYYCQNIPRSEQLRETLSDTLFFFQACQKKLGHKLPLAAYLLKPVQRITKYQLLLKDLLRYSDEGNFCKELQQALECMLVVLKCVNDSMHQISITGFPLDLSQQGDLLLQGSFSVWAENKKDIRLRIKPTRRHIFLYKKVMLFCKPAPKTTHNKATYQYKHSLKMSQIGLTESVKGDGRKFEVWLQGRQEVHTIQAANIEQKEAWVNEIKRVLFNQLEELRGEKIKQYGNHNSLKQTTSWEKQKNTTTNGSITNNRAMSCDNESQSNIVNNDLENMDEEHWSSDCTNSDDEEHPINVSAPSGRYIALADYCAIGNSEVNMREGDVVELLKVGCAGWWFVKVIGSSIEGWAPAAYLDNLHRKTFRGCSRSQDRLNDR